MRALNERELVAPLHEVIASGKPVIGICLGMQLLMSQSTEFGDNPGLGVIPGRVVRFDAGETLKVPQVGWNRVVQKDAQDNTAAALFFGIEDGAYMYFVHSFYTIPADPSMVLTTTRYGDTEFCSSMRSGNVFACQFHPERSGVDGLRMYQNIRQSLLA